MDLPEKFDENGFYYLDNFPKEELYRYMLTNINDINDWTHEREWRWCNHQSFSKTDNLPIWSINERCSFFRRECTFNFDPIVIILDNQDELTEIVNLFKTIASLENTNIQNIERTYIIVLDELFPKYSYLDFEPLTFKSVFENNLFHSVLQRISD